jgi:type I restriction enzyme S subunit
VSGLVEERPGVVALPNSHPGQQSVHPERWASVPAHWRFQRLKSVVSYRVSNVDKVPDPSEVPVRLCNYMDVYHNEEITPDMGLMETTATREEIHQFGLRVGDVLITKDSEDWKDIAVPAVVTRSSPDLVCGYHLAIIRPSPAQLDGRFLWRALQASEVNYQFRVASNGVTRYGLPKSAIGDAWLPIPPLSEQRAIVAFLDRETAKIDALIAKKERLIELLQERRRSVISRAVTCGLRPSVSLAPSGLDWLGLIPAHWRVKPLKRVADIQYGLGQPPRPMDGGLPLIRATNVERGKINPTDLIYVDPDDVPYGREPILRTGDIIVVRSGAYTGDSAIIPPEWDGAISGYDMVVRVRTIEARFLAYCLLSPYMLNSQIDLCRLRAAQPHLNAEELGSCLFIEPPGAEQREIVEHLDRETSHIDRVIAKTKAHIDELREYRTALISAAVTGKIDVREGV